MRSGEGGPWPNRANTRLALPALLETRLAPGVARRPQPVGGEPRNPRALGRAAANPGRYWTRSLKRPRDCAKHRSSSCTSSTATSSAVEHVSGKTPEDYRKYLQENPIREAVRPPSGARRRTCVPIRYATYSMTLSTVARTSSSDRLPNHAATPMILQDELVGVLSMWRTDVKAFDTRERELLEEFAAQGADRVATARPDARTRLQGEAELESKVVQLDTLREVGDAVGSSLDLDEVLDQIVSNAVILTATDGGSIMVYDESSDSFHVRAAFGSSPDLLERLRAITIDRASTLVGRPHWDQPRSRSRSGSGGPRPPSGRLVPGRVAFRPRGSDAAGRNDVGRAGDPAPEHGAVPARYERAAPDLLQPVGVGHRQRPACSGSCRPRPRNSRSPATTSRSFWPACPMNCGHR